MAHVNHMEAEKKKEHRGAVMLDEQALQKTLMASTKSTTLKNGKSTASSKSSLTASHGPTAPSTSPYVGMDSPPKQNKVPRKPNEPVDPVFRSRLIHLLAPKPMAYSDIVKKLGSSLEPQIKEVLDQVAKTQSDGTLTLKAVTYKEVKPHEWETYTYKDKITVVGNAKIAFNHMKLPDDAPEWKNLIEPPPKPNPEPAAPISRSGGSDAAAGESTSTKTPAKKAKVSAAESKKGGKAAASRTATPSLATGTVDKVEKAGRSSSKKEKVVAAAVSPAPIRNHSAAAKYVAKESAAKGSAMQGAKNAGKESP
ncbi:hypothetical protein HDU76_009911, partial [Blyttiomyces sp. JEL0837]